MWLWLSFCVHLQDGLTIRYPPPSASTLNPPKLSFARVPLESTFDLKQRQRRGFARTMHFETNGKHPPTFLFVALEMNKLAACRFHRMNDASSFCSSAAVAVYFANLILEMALTQKNLQSSSLRRRIAAPIFYANLNLLDIFDKMRLEASAALSRVFNVTFHGCHMQLQAERIRIRQSVDHVQV